MQPLVFLNRLPTHLLDLSPLRRFATSIARAAHASPGGFRPLVYLQLDSVPCDRLCPRGPIRAIGHGVPCSEMGSNFADCELPSNAGKHLAGMVTSKTGPGGECCGYPIFCRLAARSDRARMSILAYEKSTTKGELARIALRHSPLTKKKTAFGRPFPLCPVPRHPGA